MGFKREIIDKYYDDLDGSLIEGEPYTFTEDKSKLTCPWISSKHTVVITEHTYIFRTMKNLKLFIAKQELERLKDIRRIKHGF